MKSYIHYLKKLDLRLALLVCIIVALILAGYVAYQYRLLDRELSLIEGENEGLSSQLEKVKEDNSNLSREVLNKQATVDAFNGQIEDIASTVGTLEKLSQTDKEILRKYSKVYFLSENYRPLQLTIIDPKYLYNKDNTFIHTQVLPFLERLLEAARKDGVDLLIASAFRSFETQVSLKSQYTVIFGAGTANQFSADQGYSEHQLGTTVDFTTLSIGGVSSKFQADPAYQWLKDNAHKYGFTLSYPENNSYYKFEPWHWRFVGVALATFLHDGGKYFYDLDQREIDTYLIKLFD